MVYADDKGVLQWWVYTTSGNYNLGSVGTYADGNFHLFVCTFNSILNNQQTKIYVDGSLSSSHDLNGTIAITPNDLFLGAYEGSWRPFKGAIDDVRIYNCALSAAEVTALYTQPDPVTLANYYNYTDPVTNKTMLIYVNNPNANSDNVALVTCTDFFAGNRLAFQANNSATVNVWTSLGQPVLTTGVWNSQNYTTTLTLDASSTAELNWNTYNITTHADAHSGVSPSNVTVGYGGSQTLNFNASQGFRFNVAVDGVSQGQISSYTFSNVTAPHTVNVTSTQLFTITASAGGNGSITPSGPVVLDYGQTQQFNFTANAGYHVSKVLVDNASQSIADSYTFSNVQKNHTINVSFAINTYNITASSDAHSIITPGSVTVDYGGNQQFNMTADSGYYISHVYVDGNDQGNVTSYNFANVQDNHTITVTATPISSTETPETNSFPTQTVLIAVVAIAVIVAVFALAMKKGYVTIEVVEESPEESSEDYSI
jgi:hypothetical protein